MFHIAVVATSLAAPPTGFSEDASYDFAGIVLDAGSTTGHVGMNMRATPRLFASLVASLAGRRSRCAGTRNGQ
jgi:hypothetical protein